jgi:hypothetical protein
MTTLRPSSGPLWVLVVRKRCGGRQRARNFVRFSMARFDCQFWPFCHLGASLTLSIPVSGVMMTGGSSRFLVGLCPHRSDELSWPYDIHDAREIIGEHVQGHLGRNLRQALHQKMRRAHPHLERAERMLSRLAA